MSSPTASLLVTCPERKGLVAKLASFVAEHDGNIIQADHHTDFEAGLFLSRLEWEVDGFGLARDDVASAFAPLAQSIDADWRLIFSDEEHRTAIFVSKQDHCLLDLLWRIGAGELRTTAPLVIGNHPDLGGLCGKFGVPFHCIPLGEGKDAAEERQLALLRDHRIDLVVLAKYMQVLSPTFLDAAPPVINIHHSFLPAFIGDRPYHKAHARGVKLIGATAHYATAQLDDGPIIDQQVAQVSHRDNVGDLIRRGKDVERMALARAVRLHLEGKVMTYGNRTVVFE